MKKFFYGCLILSAILSIVLILSGCNLVNIKTAEKSQADIEIPDGWLQLKTDDFSIYLPGTWKGGSAQELASIIDSQSKTTPTEATNPGDKSFLVFWAYDTVSASDDIATTFNVLRVTSDISFLKDYVDKSYKNVEAANRELDSNYKVIEQQILKMGAYNEVARTITSQELFGNNLSIAQYIIKDSTIYWVMTFSANQKDFNANIDDFDGAIQSTVFQ